MGDLYITTKESKESKTILTRRKNGYMNRDGFNSSLYFRIKLLKLHTKVQDQPSHVAHEGFRVEMVVNEVSAKILWGSNKPGAHRPIKLLYVGEA